MAQVKTVFIIVDISKSSVISLKKQILRAIRMKNTSQSEENIKLMELVEHIAKKVENALIKTSRKTLLTKKGRNLFEDETIQADLIGEELFWADLDANLDNFMIISEEMGVQVKGNEKDGMPVFILDPLDGSTNFKHGLNTFCIAVAWTRLNQSKNNTLKDVIGGLVKEFNGKTFMAIKGEGAWMDDRRIHPSRVTNLKDALVDLTVYSSADDRMSQRSLALVPKVNHLRNLGSAALSIAKVAAGQLDAFVDIRDRLRVFDVAASILIAREAGAQILASNVPLTLESRVNVIMASSKELLNELLPYLKTSEVFNPLTCW